MSDLVTIHGLTPRPGAAAGPAPAPLRKVFVHTFGCQMNEVDSDRMVELLARHAWARTSHPEDADLILVNTCSVREKAEQKLLSALGRYREHKVRRGALLAVAGCVAQQEKERLLGRVPYLDFVFGPDNLGRLPELVARAARRERFAEAGWMDSQAYVFPRADAEAARGRATAFVTAMKGCDNVCSFCIVPRNRGREVSRPFPEVVAECADHKEKETVLLVGREDAAKKLVAVKSPGLGYLFQVDAAFLQDWPKDRADWKAEPPKTEASTSDKK